MKSATSTPKNKESRGDRRSAAASNKEKTVKYRDDEKQSEASFKELAKLKRIKVGSYRRFVPKTLVTQLTREGAHSWDVDKRSPCEVFWCASAFIDISGFSALASDLQSAEDDKNTSGKLHSTW